MKKAFLLLLLVFFVAAPAFAEDEEVIANDVARLSGMLDEVENLQHAGDEKWRGVYYVACEEGKALYKDYPSESDLLLLLSRCQALQGAGSEAESKERGLAKDVEDVNSMLDEAKGLKAAGDKEWRTIYATACEKGKLVFKKAPTSPDSFLIVARCYVIKGNTNKALRVLKKGLHFSPGDPELYIMQGDIHAMLVYDKAIGEDFSGGMNKSKARESYETALEMEGVTDDVKSHAHLKLGDLYDAVYQPNTARSHWEDAVEADSECKWGMMASERLQARK